MPILNVKVAATRSAQLSRTIAEGLVDLTARVLRKNPTITAVAIDYVSPEDWIVGGRTLAEQHKASFWLDIKVVDGTNTKDEKAAYLAEVFGFMRRVLGDLHEESYVLVHEVSADAYGYGGTTQEYRYVAGKLPAQRAA
ncbi:tautomerase family protein [Microvirga rosea]|uniref:tautomerase family protein n=1 Tax=Microvirga rosea TaxID=2715425 RepID=UPI001D0B8971|nr:4-oxalocrotonate tautomerase family protein [Microvirga rosea]MCB8823072.1 4-oxalocrotonate tautomerase family protein [Microvirga rosea]